MLGVAGATAVVTISFWSVIIGVAASADGSASGIAGAWALGLALVPFAFMAAAFGSGHDRAAGAVVWAMVIAVGIGATLLIIDPATALIAAYAGGATVTVRESTQTSMKRRWAFAGGSTLLVAVLLTWVTPLGLALAPAVPFTSAAIADGSRSVLGSVDTE